MIDVTDRRLTRGVVERFSVTAYIFHLPFGGMPITPFDFAMLMGLGFTGEPLIYQGDFTPIVINFFIFLFLLWNSFLIEIISSTAFSSICCKMMSLSLIHI